ncbi:hypothetical protein [Paenibacillus sp. MMO-177]
MKEHGEVRGVEGMCLLKSGAPAFVNREISQCELIQNFTITTAAEGDTFP